MTLSPDQFKFHYESEPDSELERHQIHVTHGDSPKIVGSMVWEGWEGYDEGALQSIDVDPSYQRKGLATRMWRHAQDLSRKNPNIHRPIHSTFRTPEGDAWAKSTGDWMPENQYEDN